MNTTLSHTSQSKRIVIIGAGVQGLVLAYKLGKLGYKVILYEASSQVGGLLGQERIYGIDIDRFYHHYFSADKYFLSLIKELNLEKNLFYKEFKNTYGDTGSTIKESFLLGLLLISPSFRIWQSIQFKTLFKLFSLDKYKGLGGLLYKKFGKDYKDVSSAWLWARIHARYSIKDAIVAKLHGVERLYFLYPSAKPLIQKLVDSINMQGGEIKLNTRVDRLTDIINKIKPAHVILTTPLPITKNIIEHTLNGSNFKTLGIKKWLDNLIIPKYKAAVNAICIVRKQNGRHYTTGVGNKNIGLESESYWSHLPNKYYPFLVKVAQHVAYTNLKYKVYYIGAYVDANKVLKARKFLDDNLVNMLKVDRADILTYKIFSAHYAAHVPTVFYSKHIPSNYLGGIFMNKESNYSSFKIGSQIRLPKEKQVLSSDSKGGFKDSWLSVSGIKQETLSLVRIWTSSFAQLFPWDRGVNYAIYQAHELSKRIGKV